MHAWRLSPECTLHFHWRRRRRESDSNGVPDSKNCGFQKADSKVSSCAARPKGPFLSLLRKAGLCMSFAVEGDERTVSYGVMQTEDAFVGLQ